MPNNDYLVKQYEGTCEKCKNTRIARDRYFRGYILSLVALLLVSFAPKMLFEIVNGVLKGEITFDVSGELTVAQFIAWLVFTYCTTRYFQACVGVERMYISISKMEKELFASEKILVKSESSEYLDDYPLVLDIVSVFYAAVVPSCVFLAVLLKIVVEWVETLTRIGIDATGWVLLIVDSLLALFVVVLIIAYFIFKFDVYKFYKNR